MEGFNIKDYLPLVRKPGRYIGGEVNSVKKDLSRVSLKFGLCFPDAYEVGMSHLGIQILYQILNSRGDIACERAFAPWTDMEALLRSKGAALSTLESNIPLNELDIVGFSLQYDLSFTNVLNMLDLGGVPIFTRERKPPDPFVIGGGPAAYNPEPLADFFDAFLLGDGEEAALEISDAVIEGRRSGEDRATVLKRLSRIKGVYVPSFFDVSYNPDGTVKGIIPLEEGYNSVKKRVIPDINELPLPVKPIVPFIETIHDRVTVEITRGCTRGCRFCQAGMLYRPVRERRPEMIIRIIEEAQKNTGYDEVSLLSLSAGDYTLLEELLACLMRRFVEENTALSLPSLRVGTLNANLASEIKKVRKTGFTLAPEAGSERLRTLINKGIKEDDLLSAAREVFSLGWRSLKLYFMLGLPTETEDDIIEIVRLAECVRNISRVASGGRPQINISVSSFIPKPFTPFQWEPQISAEECLKRQGILRKRLSSLKLGFKWNDPETSILEGVFSRGDRRLSKVLYRAFKKGCRFDGWSEEMKRDLWKEAFKEEGIEPAFYIYRRRPFEEVFPWDHLDAGVKKGFLYKEYENALDLAATPDCKVARCSNCGVCDHKVIKNVVVKNDSVPALTSMNKADKKENAFWVRLRFSKTGDIRFLSHLELVSAVIRAVRRAGIPIRYSRGFHPLPRLSLSQPLPVGMESIDEHMDMEIEAGRGFTAGAEALPEIIGRLNGVLPQGLKVLEGAFLPLKLSLSSGIIQSTEFLIFLKNGPLGLNIEPERIDGFLRDFQKKDSIIMRITKEDKVKEVDLKPLVGGLTLAGGDTLKLVLKKSPGISVRPQDVLVCLLNLSKEDASLIPILKTKAVQ